MKKTVVKIISGFLAAVCAFFALTSCSTANKTAMSLEKNKISVGMYSLMTSLVKGSISAYITRTYGSYNSSDFWGIIVGDDGLTNEDVYNNLVLEKAKGYLAALALFDEKGLELPQATLDQIDEEIDFFIDYDGDGSKNNFNSILSAYGANIKILREYKIMTAKIEMLESELYGSGGEKIGDALKQSYLEENYVCFKQITLPTFEYVYEKDANGDEIYYHVDSENNTLDYIIYNEALGEPADSDGDGVNNKDKYGNTIYYTEDSKICYDKINGRRSMTYDSNGNEVTRNFSADEKSQLWNDAQKILSQVQTGNYAGFDMLITMHDNNYSFESDEDRTAPVYLNRTVDYSTAFGTTQFNDVIDAVSALSPGEATFFESDVGYYIIMRCELETGAYSDEAYSSWFTDESYGVFDFNDNLKNNLFMKEIDKYLGQVEVDDEAVGKITIATIEPNYNFS